MLKIEEAIHEIDKAICDNIELIDKTQNRKLVSQNILSNSRNLVEHIAIRAYCKGQDIDYDYDTIRNALAFIKQDQKYLFLRQFHTFLQESVSHYTPNGEGAERLMLKYYPYFVMTKNFVKQQYGLTILSNLDNFPVNIDTTIEQFHKKIAEKIKTCPVVWEDHIQERMYVQKSIPFIVDNEYYFETVLSPVYDTTSKYDHFIVYSKNLICTNYAIKAKILSDHIEIEGKRMPIYLLSTYSVSIRPCELKNFAKIFDKQIELSSNSTEYINIMNYLTTSGASLRDIVLSPEEKYIKIKDNMFGKCQVKHFEPVLDSAREIIISQKPGNNIIRYLLHIMHNKTIKNQSSKYANTNLSQLKLANGCIPFDKMPFASSLIQHNPETKDLFECIDSEGREHELMARYIQNNLKNKNKMYTSKKELIELSYDIDCNINTFNNNLYYGHTGRRLKEFGKNVYINEAFNTTKIIIAKLIEEATIGLNGYSNSINDWMSNETYIDCDEKKVILHSLFEKTHVALIYGAAGTGKTYLINLISQFFGNNSKLFLANTNPAVENLRRKIKAQNCTFMTIFQFINSMKVPKDYDILIIDECSMISNSDMVNILNKAKYKIMLLTGDIYQIQSIDFGNWFYMARSFVPKHAVHELTKPHRTQDKNLLDFWEKVRHLDESITEHIVRNKYSSRLGISVFEKKSDDEIILCLNYDGLYGINNINRFLQENNPNQPIRWGLMTYKIGDPILFNESERYTPLLYNNLKGKIINIEKENDEKIEFTLEIDKSINELDLNDMDIDLLDCNTPGRSIIRFPVIKKNNSDNDESRNDKSSIIPFQIAYAVSIHKAQGLEYDSVKIIITEEIDRMITHNIFYTAITRSKKFLTIYWSPETQQNVISGFKESEYKNDRSIFAGQAKLNIIRDKNH